MPHNNNHKKTTGQKKASRKFNKKGRKGKGPKKSAGGFADPLSLSRQATRFQMRPLERSKRLVKQEFGRDVDLEKGLRQSLSKELADIGGRQQAATSNIIGQVAARKSGADDSVQRSLDFLKGVFGEGSGITDFGAGEVAGAGAEVSAASDAEIAGAGTEARLRGQGAQADIAAARTTGELAGGEFQRERKRERDRQIRELRALQQGVRQSAPFLRQQFMDRDFQRRLAEQQFGLQEQQQRFSQSEARKNRRQQDKAFKESQRQFDISEARLSKSLQKEVSGRTQEEIQKFRETGLSVLFPAEGKGPSTPREANRQLKAIGIPPKLRRRMVQDFRRIVVGSDKPREQVRKDFEKIAANPLFERLFNAAIPGADDLREFGR